jgi:hypothetical protein
MAVKETAEWTVRGVALDVFQINQRGIDLRVIACRHLLQPGTLPLAFPWLAFVWFTAQGLRVVSPPPSQQP